MPVISSENQITLSAEALSAAGLRARTGLKMPDACVLATALELRGRQPYPVSIASLDKTLLAAWRSLSRASRLSA